MSDERRHVGDPEEYRDHLRQRLVAEAEFALDSVEEKNIRAWPPNWKDQGRIDYFYRSKHVLTRDTDVDRVRSALRSLGAEVADPPDLADDAEDSEQSGAAIADAAGSGIEGLIEGVTLLKPTWERQEKRTANLIEDLDSRLGNGVATHDHAFVVTYNSICPATEPEMVIQPAAGGNPPEQLIAAVWPAPADPDAGRGVRVAVVDTGLIKGCAEWAIWLKGVTPDSEEDIDNPNQLGKDHRGDPFDEFADPYGGHGTFVAGVVRAMAPACEITVERVIDPAGFTTESQLVKQLRDALSHAPDLITMSAGGFTRNHEPSVAFKTLYDRWLSQLGGVVLIAAAGNDGGTNPFWPAAFPWCIGVGSLSKDGQRRSDFSNYGSWVDVYAPGEEIVNAYARLPYKTVLTGQVHDTSAGICRWSGTSFSTPIVAGLIAARMSRTGETARQAADTLLEAARAQFRPGIGPRLFP
jgi:subtilisin family serine protease